MYERVSFCITLYAVTATRLYAADAHTRLFSSLDFPVQCKHSLAAALANSVGPEPVPNAAAAAAIASSSSYSSGGSGGGGSTAKKQRPTAAAMCRTREITDVGMAKLLSMI